LAAIREWFAKQWQLKEFIALQMEFSRRAMKDASVRKHLATLRRQELASYASFVGRQADAAGAAPVDRAHIVALVLWAVAHGLGSLAIDAEPEWEQMYTEAAKFVFDRVFASQITHIG
jgi:hypothetical protein